MYQRPSYSAPTSLGIDERIERVLCYLGIWVTGLLFLVIERRNPTVRRHAWQSVIIFGSLSILLFLITIFGGVLSIIPIIGLLFGFIFALLHGIIWLVTAVLWIVLMIGAYLSPNTFINDRSGRFV